MSEIKKMVDALNCSALVLRHCKKGKADHVIEEVSGTLGGAGAADGVLVLVRARGENEAVLHVTGRDVDEKKLALMFDQVNCCWTSEGDASLLTASRTKQAIIEAFRKSPRSAFWPSEIAGLLNLPQNTVKVACWRMGEEGLLKRVGNGKYSWPADEQVNSSEATDLETF